jgi:hypothetical protein
MHYYYAFLVLLFRLKSRFIYLTFYGSDFNQVGKMKFLVSTEPNSKLFVIIYDTDEQIIHQEAISSRKLYNFGNLLDGKYRMEIRNANKQIIQTKKFNILTETKRDLIAIQ